MSATNNTQAALLAALKAIVNECMDNPPEPRYDHDSYLPPHLLKFAQDALACASEQAHPECTRASVISHPECTRAGVFSHLDRDQSNTTTPEQLRETIMEMDSLGQSGFGEIASMAGLALLAMEQPSTYAYNGLRLGDVATMLTAIQGKARDIENCINATAEGVGCSYVDKAQRRRWAAQHEALKSTVEGRA